MAAPGIVKPGRRPHAWYVVLAVITLVLGLWVYLGGCFLPPALRDVLGDALWAAMLAWGVGALLPAWSPGARAALALAVSYAVEVSQLLHTPALDAVRRTLPGHLVLGSGFDPRDLLAYAGGVLAVLLTESAWRRDDRRSPARH